MRLATLLAPDGSEQWGAVLDVPEVGAPWVVVPARAIAALEDVGYVGHDSWARRRAWPEDLPGHLAEGRSAHAELSVLLEMLRQALSKAGSEALLAGCGWPVAAVRLLAPIPRPRLCWGLVCNSPSFQRTREDIPILNLFPLGHQRPQGAIVGYGEDIVLRDGQQRPLFGYNVELGVVIGRGGRRIAAHDAMEHVAGYTVVTDIAGQHYYSAVPGNDGTAWHLPEGYRDWLYQVTASWGGKIADAHCPVGPYLVTADEVPDPYDLLMWTRQGDPGGPEARTRDRAHSGATINSIERVIAWYSGFATLHPGDVIHLGTMGVDGLPVAEAEAEGTVLESQIERLGTLRNRVRVTRTSLRPTGHPSHAVRTEARRARAYTDPAGWSPQDARHFYTAFGNHVDAPTVDGIPVLAVPRFLLGPASSLGMGGDIEVPGRASDLVVSVELAVVLGCLTGGLGATGEPSRAILGLAPMVSLADQSFAEAVVEPAREGERGAPGMYARWADGFNAIGPVTAVADWSGRAMSLEIGEQRASGSTSTYVAGPDALVAAIGAMTTLFPGDVVTLGSSGVRLRIPRADYERGIQVRGDVDGLGEVVLTLRAEAPTPMRTRRTAAPTGRTPTPAGDDTMEDRRCQARSDDAMS